MSEVSCLVGTEDGLFEIGGAGGVALEGRAVSCLVAENGSFWCVLDGRDICRGSPGGDWKEVAVLPEGRARCLLPDPAGLLVGTSEAHLARLREGALEPVEGFEHVPGREAWHTPWGGPPDTRSLCRDADGTVYANVHVGGVARSPDGGSHWEPTGLDIRADVHQVAAPRPGSVVVAAAAGFGKSLDGGARFRFENEGLHSTYARALALGDGTVYMTVSRGPRGGEARVYRRPLEGDACFAPCEHGLPDWFEDNIDTHCLDARGQVAAFGTRDGSVFTSVDAGETWEQAASGLPAVRGLALVG